MNNYPMGVTDSDPHFDLPNAHEEEGEDSEQFEIDHPLVYLACPYSHPDRAVRVARFEAANKAAAKLMGAGVLVFSPISHAHPIAEAGDLPLGWEYWAMYDRAILSQCRQLLILKIDGWKESAGVQGEIAIANELGIEIQSITLCEKEPNALSSASTLAYEGSLQPSL